MTYPGSTALHHFAVVGAGAWGTTFAKVLADAGREVVLWGRRDSVVAEITADHCNSGYLPGVVLPDTITATGDLEHALDGADAVVLAIPSQSMRENLSVFRDLIPPAGPVISLAKGVEIGTGLRMSEVISSVGRISGERVVVLSGPNLAREIAAGQPTATVLSCVDHVTAVRVQQACVSGYFRPYTITDVIGTEIAGTTKNVIALATGIAEGLGLGLNTSASLITRGLNEMTRLGMRLGARPETFAGLAGLGDLVATCSSPLSRNRSLGVLLGQGRSVDEAQELTGTLAEGVVSCRSTRDLALRHGIDMPITEAVFQVCHRHAPPEQMIRALMDRPPTPE
ncbi:NAD(P)H-dependent glycerol-3-phosphate dehydrogenase [Nakamurella sp. A5-74]|uniref:Glycerol-3-phosphate dehydrogenase [NAD(P)+] n=1 Tax=Nakamurella sp. A5-74 TaxID=3158264 RepID=A0AAU8DTA9_9ACTN